MRETTKERKGVMNVSIWTCWIFALVHIILFSLWIPFSLTRTKKMVMIRSLFGFIFLSGMSWLLLGLMVGNISYGCASHDAMANRLFVFIRFILFWGITGQVMGLATFLFFMLSPRSMHIKSTVTDVRGNLPPTKAEEHTALFSCFVGLILAFAVSKLCFYLLELPEGVFLRYMVGRWMAIVLLGYIIPPFIFMAALRINRLDLNKK